MTSLHQMEISGWGILEKHVKNDGQVFKIKGNLREMKNVT